MTDIGEELRQELDSAIRDGLVAVGYKGALYEAVGAIIPRIACVLTTPTPTHEEIIEHITRNGGFMRIGPSMAFVGDKVIGAAAIIDAQAAIARRSAKSTAESA